MASPNEVAHRMADSLVYTEGSLQERLVNASRRFDRMAFEHHAVGRTDPTVMDDLKFIGDVLGIGLPTGDEGVFAASVESLDELEQRDLAERIIRVALKVGWLAES